MSKEVKAYRERQKALKRKPKQFYLTEDEHPKVKEFVKKIRNNDGFSENSTN